jgi:hypothetical protein
MRHNKTTAAEEFFLSRNLSFLKAAERNFMGHIGGMTAPKFNC